MLFAVLLTGPIRSRGLLRSVIFFPVLVSTVAVGITFSVLLQPDTGLVSHRAGQGRHHRARTGSVTPSTALLSVALVDVWKGVGLATLIYIAGILAIPKDYYEAVDVDGGGAWTKFWNVTVPLAAPATFTVILLSLIGGLRSFDLIWTMTGGGPGFSSDVIASIIYKTYQAGFFGLATAGNVVLFILVTLIVYPAVALLQLPGGGVMRAVRRIVAGGRGARRRRGRLRRPLRLHVPHGRRRTSRSPRT